MSRVAKQDNSPSKVSACLGFEAKRWLAADTPTRVSVNPEFGIQPEGKANFAWIQHFIQDHAPKFRCPASC